MLKRLRSLFRTSAQSSRLMTLERTAHARPYYSWRGLIEQRLSRLVSIALLASMSIGLMASSKSAPSDATHPGIRPLVTGTDGSQTGTANLQGNFTTITAPSGQAIALSRGSNCSLLFLTGTFTSNQPFSYASTSMTSNYERILHSGAGLATTPDSVPSGCVDPSKGIGSRPGTFVGKTTSGVNVYAAVFYNFMTGSNALYVLTGTTTFSLNIFSFSAAGAVSSADLNGDGNNDLVVVNNGAATSGQIFVMLGNADGTFQTAISYATPGTASVAAVIDDFNNDGKLDILASSNNSMISVFTGKGDGSFNSAQSFVAPVPAYRGSSLTASTALTHLISADLRGTGKKDVIASNGLVLLGNGDGTFTAATSAAFPPLTATSSVGPNLATGDINRDGKLDIVVGTGSNVLTYIGKGDGTFTPGNSYASVNTLGFVTVTDIDGDGNPDIYVGDANNGLFRGDQSDTNIAYALMGNGDGTFQGAPTFTGLYNGTNLSDVNGDGMPDLVTNNINQPGSSFTVELGTTKGTFTPVSTITLPASITVSVSEFTSPVTVSTSNATISSYALGDLNGDGKADLALIANFNGFAAYFISLSNGDGTFTTPVAYGFPQIAPSTGFDISTIINNVRVGDLNHDGKADLIFNFNDVAGPTATYLQGLVVLPGNGNGTFNAPILTYTYNSTIAPGTNNSVPTVTFVGDLNGDGTPDLVATDGSFAIVNGFGVTTTTLQVYTGKGDGTFNPPTTAITSNKLASVVVADFNHDGKLDIASLGEIVSSQNNTAQGQLFLALGKGDGTFNPATSSNLSGGDTVPSAGLAAADFDGDGNVDLALLDPNSFSGIFYGKGDGTFTSVPFNGNIVPKDLINLYVPGTATALDLNQDGHPDILSGNATLLSLYGTATAAPTLFSTTTALAASASSITVGSSITFTATITPGTGSTGAPSGIITFLDGTTTLGTGTLAAGKTTYTTTALTTGTHSITAVYAGDNAFSGSTSSASTVTVTAVVLVATNTIVSTSAVNGTAVVGSSITFTGTVVPASGTTSPTGIVTFLDGTTALGTGTLASGKATISTSGLAVGTHTLTARYGGDATFSPSTSGSIPLVITAIPASDFSITLSPATATVARGSSTTSTITITPTGGFKQPILIVATGNPANTTITTSTTSLTPTDGVTPVTTTLSLQTSVTIAAQSRSLRNIEIATVLPLGFLSCTALFGFRRRRRPLQILVLGTITSLLAATGCGGSSKPPASTTNTPTPGTYSINVTGTANVGTGTLTHSATYTVTIQ